MILVDTSVWIDHIKVADPRLSAMLGGDRVFAHPFVLGELAMGSIRQRTAVMAVYRKLPQAIAASDEDVLRMIELHGLFGRGIGFIDVHLLASAILTPDTQLWSHDRRLNAAAEVLGVAARIAH